MVRGQFVSKPLIHLLPGKNMTACGLQAHKPKPSGDYHSTTAYWGDVTCWSCKATHAWKKAWKARG